MGSQQEFCLKWNNHQSNMLSVFDHLLATESFVDVTLATCDGFLLKAHKVLLSACSPYFRRLLEDNPCQHPIVILSDVRHDEMRAIVEFMYKGEVNVTEERLSNLLKTAETLKIKGLAEMPSSPSSSPLPPSLSSAHAASSAVRHQSAASSFKGAMQRPRQSLSSSRRKRKSSMMKHALSSSSVASSSSFNHRVPPQQEQHSGRLQEMEEASAAVAASATEAMVAAPHETNACLDPVSLDIVKVESMAADEDDVVAVTPDDYAMDSISSALPPSQTPALHADRDHCIGSSNHNSGTVVCAGRTDESSHFVEDGGGGGNGPNSEHDVSASGGPSTSTEKKPKKKKSSWTVTDLVRESLMQNRVQNTYRAVLLDEMRAIESVRSGRMNVLKAAMTFKIPKSSLYDYVNGRSGARLRLLKRMRPFAAPAAASNNNNNNNGSSGGSYVARALPFLNPEAAAAILASGELGWSLAGAHSPLRPPSPPLLADHRHHFASSAEEDPPFTDHEDAATSGATANDEDDEELQQRGHLSELRDFGTADIAAEETMPSSMMTMMMTSDTDIDAAGSP